MKPAAMKTAGMFYHTGCPRYYQLLINLKSTVLILTANFSNPIFYYVFFNISNSYLRDDGGLYFTPGTFFARVVFPTEGEIYGLPALVAAKGHGEGRPRVELAVP
jgi:hypothetical protein